MIRRLSIAFIILFLLVGCVLNKKTEPLASNACPPLNQDPPNTVMRYEKDGLAFDIPYNSNWGFPEYKERVPSSGVNQNLKTIEFGVPSRLISQGYCDQVARRYMITFSNEDMDVLLERADPREAAWSKLKLLNASQTTINGLTVIEQRLVKEYDSYGINEPLKDCERFKFFIIGLKNNYTLTDGTRFGECASEEELTKIVQTMRIDEPFIPGKRVLLTPENVEKYPNNCDDVNEDPPSTKVTYSNTEKGFSFEVPYNEAWGSEKFSINPYDEKSLSDYQPKDTIFFGPLLSRGEGCGWHRSNRIAFIKKETFDDYLKRWSSEKIELTKMHIGAFDVLKHDDTNQAMCGGVTLFVMGEQYIYEVAGDCGAKEEELRKIVETFKILSL